MKSSATVFRLKKLNAVAKHVFKKDWCCVRGELQASEVDLDENAIHAPIASNEFIRLIMVIEEAGDLIFKGGDVDSA